MGAYSKSHDSWSKFDKTGHIDLLLGADICANVQKVGLVQRDPNQPIAQNTVFGWILYGEIPQRKFVNINISAWQTQVEIDTTLRKFWELEEIPLVVWNLFPKNSTTQWCWKIHGSFTIQNYWRFNRSLRHFNANRITPFPSFLKTTSQRPAFTSQLFKRLQLVPIIAATWRRRQC